MPSRRQFLHASGAGAVASLAGCSAVPALGPKMDFAVENARDETVPLDVAFLRPRVSERSEALVYRDFFKIPPRENPDDMWRVEDVATVRPYRIEIAVGGSNKSYHYHYRPDCSDDSPYEIGVVVNLNEGGGVTFTQTQCSDDELFL